MLANVLAVAVLATAVAAAPQISWVPRVKSTSAASPHVHEAAATSDYPSATTSCTKSKAPVSTPCSSSKPIVVATPPPAVSTKTPCTSSLSTKTPCSTSTKTPCSTTLKPVVVATPPPASVETPCTTGTAVVPAPVWTKPAGLNYTVTKPSEAPAIVPSSGAVAEHAVPAVASLGMVAAVGFLML